jgi:hypothetical protein
MFVFIQMFMFFKACCSIVHVSGNASYKGDLSANHQIWGNIHTNVAFYYLLY